MLRLMSCAINRQLLVERNCIESGAVGELYLHYICHTSSFADPERWRRGVDEESSSFARNIGHLHEVIVDGAEVIKNILYGDYHICREKS